MKLIWIAAGLALATSAGANASSGKKNDESAPEEKIVCKTERITGSRTKAKRTCMTQREWDAIAAESRRGIDQINQQATVNRGSGQVLPGG